MITPADYPCHCRACGVMILESIADMCPDCEDDMNAYYDDRSAEESEWDEASATADAEADAQAEPPYYPPDEGEDWDYGHGPEW